MLKSNLDLVKLLTPKPFCRNMRRRDPLRYSSWGLGTASWLWESPQGQQLSPCSHFLAWKSWSDLGDTHRPNLTVRNLTLFSYVNNT